MLRSICFARTAFAWVVVAWALAPPPALATTVSTSVGVTATYGQASPGVIRNSTASGPLTDTASDVSIDGAATGSATVDAMGLHAVSTATRSGGAIDTAAARANAGLVNEFMLVPRAGFTGTHATVQIPFSFSGSFMAHPSLAACPTCAAGVDATLGVDGLAGGLSFNGAHSLATMQAGNPAFVAGGVLIAGTITGLVPVNTVQTLRAGLSTTAFCQNFANPSCGMEALFASALSYTGFSPDEVDIVWGLTPTLVPEPASGALLAMGALGLVFAPRVSRALGRALRRSPRLAR